MEDLLLEDISLAFHKRQGRFVFRHAGGEVEQTVCEFLHTFSFLVGKNIEEHLLNTGSEYDTITIPLSIRGDSITLDLHLFIRTRNTYLNQMFLLKLEDLLTRKGINAASLY